METKKFDQDAPAPKYQKVRITLQSTEVPNLEQVSADIVKGCKEKSMNVKGPARMPTKVMRITTRKTPCGEGSKTWDRFQMRIHKRVIDISAHSDMVLSVISTCVVPGVSVEVTVAGDQ